MEKLRKQLLGLALILTGMVSSISAVTFDVWVPIINGIPWGAIGIILSLIGLVIVYKNTKDN